MRTLSDDLEGRLGTDWTEQVAAIGLTGQLPTLVCLDEAKPLGAAITWKDGRADAWAASRLDAARRTHMYALTGMPIDDATTKPCVTNSHFGRGIAAVRTILSAKDYLLFELTGLRLTEPSTAAGYGIYDLRERRFSEDLADFWQLPAALLPRVTGANTLAGPLNEAGAALLGLRAGIPVSTGAADSVCASFAMAGLDERVVSISFGSSAVVIGARHLCNFGRHHPLPITVPHGMTSGTAARWISWQPAQVIVG